MCSWGVWGLAPIRPRLGCGGWPPFAVHITRGLLAHITRGLLAHITRGLLAHITRGLLAHITRGLLAHITRGLLSFYIQRETTSILL